MGRMKQNEREKSNEKWRERKGEGREGGKRELSQRREKRERTRMCSW